METIKKETLPQLNPVELRVLGSLIEKNKITPDYYPMTLNALTLACNQKTSRKPVVEYDEPTVVMALDSLKKMGLVALAMGGTSRSVKYKHNFTMVYSMTSAELSALCLLFLRGPLTPGEINSSSARLYEFESLEEVNATLQKLSAYEKPFVMELAKRPGQKEARFVHLFAEYSEDADSDFPEEPARKQVSELEQRLFKVETELAEVKEQLEKIMKELY